MSDAVRKRKTSASKEPMPVVKLSVPWSATYEENPFSIGDAWASVFRQIHIDMDRRLLYHDNRLRWSDEHLVFPITHVKNACKTMCLCYLSARRRSIADQEDLECPSTSSPARTVIMWRRFSALVKQSRLRVKNAVSQHVKLSVRGFDSSI
jgi:hypothetical protein